MTYELIVFLLLWLKCRESSSIHENIETNVNKLIF